MAFTPSPQLQDLMALRQQIEERERRKAEIAAALAGGYGPPASAWEIEQADRAKTEQMQAENAAEVAAIGGGGGPAPITPFFTNYQGANIGVHPEYASLGPTIWEDNRGTARPGWKSPTKDEKIARGKELEEEYNQRQYWKDIRAQRAAQSASRPKTPQQKRKAEKRRKRQERQDVLLDGRSGIPPQLLELLSQFEDQGRGLEAATDRFVGPPAPQTAVDPINFTPRPPDVIPSRDMLNYGMQPEPIPGQPSRALIASSMPQGPEAVPPMMPPQQGMAPMAPQGMAPPPMGSPQGMSPQNGAFPLPVGQGEVPGYVTVNPMLQQAMQQAPLTPESGPPQMTAQAQMLLSQLSGMQPEAAATAVQQDTARQQMDQQQRNMNSITGMYGMTGDAAGMTGKIMDPRLQLPQEPPKTPQQARDELKLERDHWRTIATAAAKAISKKPADSNAFELHLATLNGIPMEHLDKIIAEKHADVQGVMNKLGNVAGAVWPGFYDEDQRELEALIRLRDRLRQMAGLPPGPQLPRTPQQQPQAPAPKAFGQWGGSR